MAAGVGLGANLINNVPMTVVAARAIGPLLAQGTLRPATAYAALLGADIGPNLTIVGSLATLIWLAIVRDRGMDVSLRDYLRVGLLATPPTLLAAAIGLWLSLRLLGA